jgi:3-oxoacyl-[acyl-carrier-protein] synthase III
MAAAVVVGGYQLCTAPAANAQAQVPGIQAPVVADIPDQKLDAAATAMVGVDRVQQEYREKLKGIAEEANKAAEKAVTDQGLSVDEFKTIIVAAQTNPDLRKKIVGRLPNNE